MTTIEQPKNKAERAFEYLREKIRTREFEPGYRLVLSQLAQDLDMSVVPVREAIRQLEAEKLITYEKNVGARVTSLNREAYFETMETVALLESRATALSVPLLSADDIAQARDVNEQMRALLENFSPEEFTDLNHEFHTLLFSQCRNRHLVELVNDEWDRLGYFRVSTFRYVPARAKDSVEEHERILKLIEAGAAPGYVEMVCREHRLATSDSYRTELDAAEAAAGIGGGNLDFPITETY